MTTVQKFCMLLLLAASCVFTFFEAHAQATPTWRKVCADNAKIDTCRIEQALFLSKKDASGKPKTVGRVLKLTVLYATDSTTKKRSPYLSIQMPLGVDLRPGAVIKVDKNKDIPVQYLQCTNAGCDASVPLNDQLLKALKAGTDMFVGFRPWGSNQTTILKASLMGFTRAISGIK